MTGEAGVRIGVAATPGDAGALIEVEGVATIEEAEAGLREEAAEAGTKAVGAEAMADSEEEANAEADDQLRTLIN